MNNIDTEDRLLTYEETMAYLKVSESTLNRLIRDPENPLKRTYVAERRPRIKLADIHDWLTKQDEIYNKKLEKKDES